MDINIYNMGHNNTIILEKLERVGIQQLINISTYILDIVYV